jgi:hypothetical protein
VLVLELMLAQTKPNLQHTEHRALRTPGAIEYTAHHKQNTQHTSHSTHIQYTARTAQSANQTAHSTSSTYNAQNITRTVQTVNSTQHTAHRNHNSHSTHSTHTAHTQHTAHSVHLAQQRPSEVFFFPPLPLHPHRVQSLGLRDESSTNGRPAGLAAQQSTQGGEGFEGDR